MLNCQINSKSSYKQIWGSPDWGLGSGGPSWHQLQNQDPIIIWSNGVLVPNTRPDPINLTRPEPKSSGIFGYWVYFQRYFLVCVFVPVIYISSNFNFGPFQIFFIENMHVDISPSDWWPLGPQTTRSTFWMV